MLQSMKYSNINSIDYKKIEAIHKHLPQAKVSVTANQNCSRCFYVNEAAHSFCTNCGYPLHHDDARLLYQFRIKQRKEMLHKNLKTVQVARILLYIVAAFFTAGIGFLFGNLDNSFFLTFLSLTSSFLFFLLARWSKSKPFTALLTAFVIVLTFSTIAVFGEFTSTFTSVSGLYTIVACTAVSYFLLRGVQGAYKADLINEEMQIN
ncbi:hypothetical protein BH10BAC2_BH10BAC2_13410 [soil metagenome]